MNAVLPCRFPNIRVRLCCENITALAHELFAQPERNIGRKLLRLSDSLGGSYNRLSRVYHCGNEEIPEKHFAGYAGASVLGVTGAMDFAFSALKHGARGFRGVDISLLNVILNELRIIALLCLDKKKFRNFYLYNSEPNNEPAFFDPKIYWQTIRPEISVVSRIFLDGFFTALSSSSNKQKFLEAFFISLHPWFHIEKQFNDYQDIRSVCAAKEITLEAEDFYSYLQRVNLADIDIIYFSNILDIQYLIPFGVERTEALFRSIAEKAGSKGKRIVLLHNHVYGQIAEWLKTGYQVEPVDGLDRGVNFWQFYDFVLRVSG